MTGGNRFSGYAVPAATPFPIEDVLTGDSGSTSSDTTPAPLLTGPQGVSIGYGFSATAPPALGYGGGRALFYQWTATSNGTLTVGTSGGTISDTVMTLFTNLASPVVIDSDDDSGPGFYSLISHAVTSGTTYYIVVDGYNSTPFGGANAEDPAWDPSGADFGTFTLTWSFV